jgi:hypothetical protein
MSSMKNSVAKLLIACRFNRVAGSEHETQEDERGLVGDATMERNRFKSDEAQQKLPTFHDRLQS